MDELIKVPLWQKIMIIIILILQSSWLFRDAQKRNARPWFWGIWGIMNAPTPFIVYILTVRKGYRPIARYIKTLRRR